MVEGGLSAYKLRFVLGRILGAHREVSFGVLYPLLNKLEAQGFIEQTETLDKHNKKLINITDAGKDRFMELMEQPVTENAHLDDVYNFKLSGLRAVPEMVPEVLDAYRSEKKKEIIDYKSQLEELKDRHLDAPFYEAGKRIIELHLSLANSYLNWIDNTEEYYRNI
jgi:DNA-binding PadR family transcriptional regulator